MALVVCGTCRNLCKGEKVIKNCVGGETKRRSKLKKKRSGSKDTVCYVYSDLLKIAERSLIKGAELKSAYSKPKTKQAQ